eukprot:scaffold305813_cov18-Tisochrysis_lutea.AAC.1
MQPLLQFSLFCRHALLCNAASSAMLPPLQFSLFCNIRPPCKHALLQLWVLLCNKRHIDLNDSKQQCFASLNPFVSPTHSPTDLCLPLLLTSDNNAPWGKLMQSVPDLYSR